MLFGGDEKKGENSLVLFFVHRMVIDFAICTLLLTPPSRAAEALVPGLRSKIFQNFRLSSAAATRTINNFVR
jgi:hypothetical protein